jgi:Zn-dependent proteases
MWSIESLILIIPIVIFSLSVHEFFHAWSAWKLGDPTAKRLGRLTLNPLAHLDPFGILFAAIFGFGWAKPVPINPYYFKSPMIHFAISASAGPLSNFGLAVLSAIIYKLIYSIFGMTEILHNFFITASFINLALFFFNFIPIPPLDGSRVFFALIPRMTIEKAARYELFGFIGILAIVLLDRLGLPIFEIVVVKPSRFVMSILYGF